MKKLSYSCQIVTCACHTIVTYLFAASQAYDVTLLNFAVGRMYMSMVGRGRGMTGTRKVGRVLVPETRPKLRIPAGIVKHCMK